MATRVTRQRPVAVEQPQDDLAARARALLAKRQEERAHPDAQRLMKMDREPRLKLPPSAMEAVEYPEEGVTLIKGSKPRAFKFHIEVRVYGPAVDWGRVNEIMRPVFMAARSELRKALHGNDCHVSFVHEPGRDDSGVEREEI